MYNWTLQSYLRLKESGFQCSFVTQFPLEGIVISHRDCLDSKVRPGPRCLLVCIMGDKEQPRDRGLHPYAQYHVLQNREDPRVMQRGWFSGFAYIPFWPQPGLIPRDPSRGDRVENIAFFGYTVNLAPELKTKEWEDRLKAEGFRWRVISPDRFHDYSDVDAMVAVRSFANQSYLFKPPTKLYNAWHAGVPALLGCESAFRAERKNDLDYIEVTSPEMIIESLVRLRDDRSFRQAMVTNGWSRAVNVQPEQIVERWRILIEEILTPAHRRWSNSSGFVQFLFLNRGSAIRAFHAGHAYLADQLRMTRAFCQHRLARIATRVVTLIK